MDACAAWARGARFADVLNLAPDVFEGSLVRAVRRLEELMRQVGGQPGGVTWAGSCGWLSIRPPYTGEHCRSGCVCICVYC